MDEATFDQLTRAVGAAGTRRRLLGVVSGLGLGGLLGVFADESAEAKRKRQGHKHRKNKKNNGNGKGNGNGGNGGLGSTQCVATGGDCDQDSDCCSSNCFTFSCAEKVHSCSGTRCVPPAKGCAGNVCCNGSVACDVCCDPGITQCNQQGNCCAANCAGRQCGPDGCGNGGTCGTCPTNSTCNQAGQCIPNCVPQCQGKQCGPDQCGGICGNCPSGSVCDVQHGQCVAVPNCDVCPTCRYTTVQAAVQDLNGPATIKICPGTYDEAIFVTRNLTLVGSGQGNGAGDTILQWSGQNGVVVINDNVDSFTLKDLRITGATDGGITSEATTLTMTNCTVTANRGRSAGIQSSGTLIMTGCTISDNAQTQAAEAFGGGISALGGATLTNCTVTGNSAISTNAANSALGGGIYVFAGTLTLSGTSVTGNSTNGNGGGVYLDEAANGLVLHNNSSITNNTPNNCASAETGQCA